MPAYKLTYFNGRGSAEIVRLVFAAGGIEYEDVRLERDQWPDLKPSLAGKTPLEQARVDMIMDGMEEMGSKGYAAYFEKNEDLTLADITFFNMATLVGTWMKVPDVDEFSGLKKVMEHVTSNPGLAKWLKERPETPF
uniref:glutathione transferase n=1 Tax=Branchiostoma floridae TaxID=7739 RepID=C3Y703_BRAFL|eukprot:XP_002608103.1 hypothetical protein BRAFLDRAFT_91419 [Branchiostoma floridae]